MLDADLPARGRRAHRPGPPAAAPRRAISSSSGTSCSRRSTASRTRRTISSSSCTPQTLWPEHPLRLLASSAPATPWRALDASDLRGAPSDAATIRGNCVIAAAGNLEHDALLDAAGSRRLVRGGRPAPRRGRPVPPARTRGRARPEERDAAQTHIVFGDRHRSRYRRSAPVRARHPDQRVRRRHVEPALPAGPRGAGAGLRGLRVPDLLSQRRAAAASTSAPSRRRADQATEAIRAEYDRLAREGLHRRTSWPTASSSSRARSMLSLESPISADVPAGRRRRCTTTGTARSTRCWPRSTR